MGISNTVRRILVSVVFLAALLNSCTKCERATSPNASSSNTAGSVLAEAKDQIIRIANGTEPKELDPATATGEPEAHIIENLFECLTTHDPLSLKPLPGVAERWEISSDGLVYVFYLRKNAKWSDGTPVTAHDFVFSWIRLLDPATASEYAYQIYHIKNAEAFNAGTIKDASQLGLKAKDDYTLEIILENPVPFFLQLTAFFTLCPTPRHIIKKYPQREWTKEGNMVSNGPFKLSEWRLNQHVKLEPNPHYWDKEKMHLTAAYFLPIENIDSEEKAFMSGEVHLTNSVPLIKVPTYLAELKKSPDVYHPYRTEPYLGVYFYRLNTTKAPFNDKRVRRALAITLDRQLLVDKVTRNGEKPALSFTPPGIEGYTFPSTLQATVNKETIAEAQALLAEAGYPEGRGMPPINILYNTNENHKKIALAVRQMWKDHLGIEVGLFNQEWKVYLDSQRKLQFELSRSGWIGDYADPNTFLDLFMSKGSNNQTGWGNKEYDRLIDLSEDIQDQAARFEYFRQAEAILMDEMPVIPVYLYSKARLVSEKVKLVLEDKKVLPWKGNLTDRMVLKYFALAK
jgi:oligopeptide transport system substrate-binding protein